VLLTQSPLADALVSLNQRQSTKQGNGKHQIYR
jgi:hypothetical protein